jgi:hypothetical protein
MSALLKPDEDAPRWWHVDVHYQTFAGNMGHWSGPVFSSSDDVFAIGDAKARKARKRWLMKVYAGDARPYPIGYVPSDA